MQGNLTLIAPFYLYLPSSARKHYLSFNNYHSWPIHTRTALRRAYSDVIKAQVPYGLFLFKKEVSCTVTMHPPYDTRIRDTDDHCFLHAKWANDALKESGVWEDDNCVINVQMLAGTPVKIPHVTISYRDLEGYDKPMSTESLDKIQAIQPKLIIQSPEKAPQWGIPKQEYPKKRSPKR